MTSEYVRPLPRVPDRGRLREIIVRLARAEGHAGPYSGVILFERYVRFTSPVWQSFPPPPRQPQAGDGQSVGYWFDKLLGELVESGDLRREDDGGYWVTPQADAQSAGLFPTKG